MKNKRTQKYINTTAILSLFVLLPLASCEDFTDVGPPKTEVVSEVVFSSDATSLSAISGIYSMMMADNSFSNTGIELYTGTSGDELISYSIIDAEKQFFLNSKN